jgi:hypothetical protein
VNCSNERDIIRLGFFVHEEYVGMFFFCFLCYPHAAVPAPACLGSSEACFTVELACVTWFLTLSVNLLVIVSM